MSVQPQSETLNFEAEANQILHLVTHSLYSDKEIFLRELVSNSSDAADKLRFEALSDAALYENDSELKIWIDFDKKAKTLTIRDNGIGMTRDEIIENLGTIAKSGTKDFLSKLTGEQSKDTRLIGQFGVGFYSAFIVADKISVQSRRAGTNSDQGVRWTSDGKSGYSIENVETPLRGTEITLHLKKDEEEFLDQYRIESVVKKYSDHIPLPIVMSKEVEVESDSDSDGEGDDANKKLETRIEEQVINKATALWTLSKSQIKDEDYHELYKHISHDFEDPFTWAHNKVEGKLEYTSLLFIPKRPPFDLFQPELRRGLKLYIQRVFIMDDAEQLLPSYLRFVRGIVDSNDLPLNVSREILQNNKVIEGIKNGCVRRVLELLEKMAKNEPEQYAEFWKNFGAVLKEGPAEDFANRERIAKLLRFSSSHTDAQEQNVSLEDYVSRMKEDQDEIYFVTADSFNACKSSPHLEVFRQKGIEVLLLADRVDEWLTAHLQEFDGKKLKSVSKGDVSVSDEPTEEDKELEKDFDSVIEQMKTSLGEKIQDVRITQRLTDSPACLVSDDNEMSAHLQRMLEAAGQDFPATKPILEINVKHPFVTSLRAETDDERFGVWSHVLFDSALLAEGGQLEDPGSYVKRINELLLR